jgi:hypothetical protein
MSAVPDDSVSPSSALPERLRKSLHEPRNGHEKTAAIKLIQATDGMVRAAATDSAENALNRSVVTPRVVLALALAGAALTPLLVRSAATEHEGVPRTLMATMALTLGCADVGLSIEVWKALSPSKPLETARDSFIGAAQTWWRTADVPEDERRASALDVVRTLLDGDARPELAPFLGEGLTR